MTTLLAFVGRVLIALLFIASGFGKLGDIAGTQAMLSSVGMPKALAWPTALFEIIAGFALVFGVMTRLTALLLAGFSLLAALLFHNDFADPMQSVMLLKNVAIAGGLLCLCAADTARWSYDALRRRRREDLAAREAEREAHDADLRAARAEGVAAGTRSREASVSDIHGRTVVSDTPSEPKREWL